MKRLHKKGVDTLPPILVDEAAKIVATDPKPIFDRVFGDGFTEPYEKDKLETEVEYRARLAAMGTEGIEATFVLVNLYNLDVTVEAFPEKGVYYIESSHCFYEDSVREKSDWSTAIQVASDDDESGFTRSYGIVIQNPDNLPKGMKRTVKEHGLVKTTMGLPVRSTDPAFREKLRRNRITLAFRGRVGPLAQADKHPMGGTDKRPLLGGWRFFLPFVVTEAYAVDLDTNVCIARCSVSPSLSLAGLKLSSFTRILTTLPKICLLGAIVLFAICLLFFGPVGWVFAFLLLGYAAKMLGGIL